MYLLSKVPGSPVMQTNRNADSLFFMVKLPSVGPDAARNLSSLGRRWGGEVSIYLLTKTNTPKALNNPPNTQAQPLSYLPGPSPTPGSRCGGPLPGASLSAPGQALRLLRRRAVPPRRRSLVWLGPEINQRVPSIGARGSLCQRRGLSGKFRPFFSPYLRVSPFRTPGSKHPAVLKGAGVWQGVLHHPA